MLFGTRLFGRDPLGGGHAGSPPPPVVNPGLRLQIGPLDATPYLQHGTYRLREVLNGNDEAECTLISRDGYAPSVDEEFILTRDDGRLFAGFVHERDLALATERDETIITIQVRAVDYSDIATRRIVAEVYTDLTAGAMVTAIHAKYLAPEGVELGNIEIGPVFGRVLFNYMSVADCLNELSENSGFHWKIDAHKRLHFFQRVFLQAPFSIDSSSGVFHSMQGSKTRNDYRNVQYLDGGVGVTDPRTESFHGDGANRTFSTAFKVNQLPEIRKNGAIQTVGIRGVDTGKQWYWNAGENAITHDPAELALTAADLLTVTYQGQWDVMGIVEDGAAILDRKSVRGGTGRTEQLVRDDQLNGQDAVQDKALALLRRYGTLDETVTFSTYLSGLAVGQLVPVDFAPLCAPGSYLITEMSSEPVGIDETLYTVTATTGELKSTAEEWFANILATDRKINLRDNDILQEVTAIRDPVGVADTIGASLDAFAAGEWGGGDVGTGEFG